VGGWPAGGASVKVERKSLAISVLQRAGRQGGQGWHRTQDKARGPVGTHLAHGGGPKDRQQGGAAGCERRQPAMQGDARWPPLRARRLGGAAGAAGGAAALGAR
jgi:hypothetical protein